MKDLATITLVLYVLSKVFMFAIIPLWVWAKKKKQNQTRKETNV
jgi:hypothetical protein